MNTFVFFHRPLARARKGKPRSGGFALIEALMALLLFSIGILGLMGLQARSVSVAGEAQGRSRAALIADRCASQMQLMATNATITGTGGTATGATVAQLCNQPAWNPYVSNPAQGGLLGGTIQAQPESVPTAPTVNGPPVVPFNVLITVTWTPPTPGGAANSSSTSSPSTLVTQTTLLVKNS